MLSLKKLNKFLSLDWDKIENDLHKINEGIKELEKLKREIEAISEVLGLFYDEKYGFSKNWKPELYDLERC